MQQTNRGYARRHPQNYRRFSLMKLHSVFLSAVLLLLSGCAENFQNTAHSPAIFKPSPQTAGVKSATAGVKSAAVNAGLKRAGFPADQEDRRLLENAFDLCEDSRKLWQKGENRKALAALDQAYSLILRMKDGDDPDMTQQKEDLRVMISKRILEIYASGRMLATGKNKAIPMTMNSYIRDEIAVLMRTDKAQKEPFFIGAFRRSGRYRPFILEELKKAGLPPELSWLPLIESGFRVYALSNARALGLWQFIQSTGSRFGLKRSRYVDERLDPEKATKAAVAYLKELHDIFGDWTTVLAAYNCGEGRVLSVIREQNVNYLDNFWDLYKDLPQETAQFVPRFLAALHIVANPKQYGIDAVVPHSPPEYEIVNISDQIHLKDAASAMGISQESLKELNPELRCNIVPGNRYPLKVPPDMGGILLSKTEDVAGSGKTFFSESVPVKSEKPFFWESLPEESGTGRRSAPAPTRAKSEKARKPKPIRNAKHEVKKGETLWAIARRYNMTLKEIRELNNLPNAYVRIGDALTVMPKKDWIADKAEKPLKRDEPKTYQVKHGDVAFQIAKRYNISLDRLLKMNRLSDASKIYPGQTLHLE